MSFLSHIFLSAVLVVQGLFGHAQQPVAIAPVSTTTVSATVSVPQPNTPAIKVPAVAVPKDVPASTASPVAPATPPNSTLCNGGYYTKCSSGSALICPSNGGAAYCAPTVPAQQTPNASAPSSANKTWTTPSGAVIGADGTVLSTPNVPTVSTTVSPTLVVYPGLKNITYSGSPKTAHLHMEWSTNIPTDSKIFLTPTGQISTGGANGGAYVSPLGSTVVTTTQVVPSASGNSTQHFVDVNYLKINYQYSYTIEAISGIQDQKSTGTILTNYTGLPITSQY